MRYEDMEFENYSHILNALTDELESPSRADIAKHLGLSRTTVSNIVNNLIAKKILLEGDTIVTSAKGRPGSALMLNSKYWHTLGACFTSNEWIFVVADLTGSVKERFAHKISQPLTPQSMLISLVEGINDIKKKSKYKLIPAVGIGAPGVVDQNTGEISFAHDLGWHSPIAIKTEVEEKTGYSAFVRNRYCLEGLAEYTYANTNREKDMIYFGIGSGIRSAMFSNGVLIDGHNFTAGRMGHIQVKEDGELCSCGRRGCLLTVANEDALSKHAKHLSGKDRTAAQVITDADKGEETAMEAIWSMANEVSKVLNIIIDVMNPQSIVMGGSIGSNSEYLKACLLENLGTAYRLGGTPSVRCAKMGNDSGAIGASCLVKQNILPLLMF